MATDDLIHELSLSVLQRRQNRAAFLLMVRNGPYERMVSGGPSKPDSAPGAGST